MAEGWDTATRREMTLGRVLGLALGSKLTLAAICPAKGGRQSFECALVRLRMLPPEQ